MNQATSIHQRQAADGRREALTWLARRLDWERRLGQLRPSGTEGAEVSESKQAA
jgi:hypothetical protein